jgi:DNA-binding transcriptional LysR family regulator
MEMSNVDLNLLVVFDAILQSQSVTAAAERVGLSQSTMSYELAKLRRLFDDRLFVRMSTGMQPTPRALQLADPVRRALEIVNSEILKKFHFDPLKSKRTFTLCMSDIAEVNFLPKILHLLAREAPGVSVKTVAIDRQDVGRAMAKGELDLLIGFFPDLKKAGFYQQSLFLHTYACVVRKGHPRVDSEITLQQFLSESHVVVRPEGRSYEVVERFLEKSGFTRRIVLVTPHFTSVPFIIAASDLITILPISLAEAFAKFAELKTVSLPFSVPTYNIKQHWHERFHNDEENMWLRKKIAHIFIVK